MEQSPEPVGAQGGLPAQPAERLIAGAAFVVAIATALLAFFTFQAEREHDRLSVRPSLAIDRNLDISFGPLRPRPLMSFCDPVSKAVLRRSLEPEQYVSIRYTEKLADAGI